MRGTTASPRSLSYAASIEPHSPYRDPAASSPLPTTEKRSSLPQRTEASLCDCIERNRVGDARSLIAAGISVDSRRYGTTALMIACERGHLEAASMLLELKADVNASTLNGNTALMSASLAGHVSIVKLLLDAHADLDAQTVNGSNATSLAERYGHGDVHALLQAAKAAQKAKLERKQAGPQSIVDGFWNQFSCFGR